MTTFVLSAASGLQKGIARFSSLNAVLLLILGVFAFIAGPTIFSLALGVESFGVFIDNFFTKSLFTGTAGEDQWPQWWSIFYWAVWFSWAPVAALFLGKISCGYTVREFLRVNLLYPALFASVWILIFSGTALYYQAHTGSIFTPSSMTAGWKTFFMSCSSSYPFQGYGYQYCCSLRISLM